MVRAEVFPRALLDELGALRGAYGRVAAARKFKLLVRLLSMPINRGLELARLHDELLFAAGFPDNADIHAVTAGALSTFAKRVRRLSAAERRKLDDSGIAGTAGTHDFSYDVARWLLLQREHVTIDWRVMEDPERLDLLLRQTLLPVEVEAFDSGEFSTEEWVGLASAKSAAQTLAWLLGSAPERSPGAGIHAWRDLYDAAEVQLAWERRESPWSVSRNRAPVVRIIKRRAFRHAPMDVASHVLTPLTSIRRLRGSVAEQWRDACIATLTARAREVWPIVCANLEEIYVIPLGDGVDLCVVGVTHEHRLPLEANYGYVMFANGVPIGYGGATALGAQANTGINIFESFRRTEAAFLFAQTLRSFRTLFGVTRFIVNPYQIGADNDEALESGSYWFYHRLGFRSRDPIIAALAEAENARNAKRRGRRSSLAILRRLASSDVVLELPDVGETALFEERWVLTIGRAVAEHLAPHALGRRREYLTQLSHELCTLLTGEKRPLRPEERAGAVHLVPVIALLRDEVARWPSADRAALWELVGLKGRPQERPFAQASRAHARWWRAVANTCERMESA
jgi:hypothetical protein